MADATTRGVNKACLVAVTQGWDVDVACLLVDCCHLDDHQGDPTRHWALSWPGRRVLEEKCTEDDVNWAGHTPEV